MSLRYATTVNEQADGVGEEGTGGQRLAFKESSRALGNENLGVSSSSRLSHLFPSTIPDHDPESRYALTIDGSSVSGNPDFIAGVNLNYGGAEREPILNGTANLSNPNNSVDDKPQYGAPNITTPNVNNPLETRERTSFVERKDAGFGTREVEGENVNSPSLTRERIGTYFTNHSRRSPSSFGTSKPVSSS